MLNRRTLWIVCFTVMVSVLTAGCSDENVQEGDGPVLATVTLALEAEVDSPTCPVEIRYPDIKSLRLRIFNGVVEDLDTAVPMFDTSSTDIARDGCLSFVQCAGGVTMMDEVSGKSYEERTEACQEEGGALIPATLINVQELESSEGVTAYLELFSGTNCEADSVAFVATRGGIPVSPDGPQTVHMSPLCKGHFTMLPSPTREDMPFLRELALTECERDCDCVEPFKEKLKKECTESQLDQITVPGAPVHCVESYCSANYGFEWLLKEECETDSDCSSLFSSSVCGDSGYCDLTSYYPLEPSRRMAFHSSETLSDGSIALAGGFNEADENTFVSLDAEVLRFDPHTLTFQAVAAEAYAEGEFDSEGLDRAMHSTVYDEEKSLLIMSGGMRSLEIRFETDESGVRRLKIQPTSNGPNSDDNFRADLVVLDGQMKGGSTLARQTDLEVMDGDDAILQPVALQATDIVLNSGKGEYLFAGGLAPAESPGVISSSTGQDTAPFGNMAVNCVFGSDLQAKCLVNTGVFVNPRVGSTGACFDRDDEGLCTQFATIGGAESTEARVGELFISSAEGENGRFVKLASDGVDMYRRAKFGKSVELEDGRVLMIGGADEKLFQGPPNLGTNILRIDNPDEEEPIMKSKSVSGKTDFGGIEGTFRSHHAVTELEDGDFLIMGGLNNVNLPTSQVLIFDTENEEYREETLRMARARFGHQATRIEAGLMKGAILVTGGMSSSGDETTPRFVPTAEIFVP